MSTHLDMTPEPDEIVQAEEPTFDMPTLAVGVRGVVNTRELPGRIPAYRTEQAVSTTLGVRLLTMDPRRKFARIWGVGGDIWVSATQAGAQAGASGSVRVASNTVFPIDHFEEVWACSVTAATDISIATTFWSE